MVWVEDEAKVVSWVLFVLFDVVVWRVLFTCEREARNAGVGG